MIQFDHDIRFITTPEELRQIADKMEERYANLKPGDSKEIKRFEKDGSTLRIVANQEEMGPPSEYEGSG